VVSEELISPNQTTFIKGRYILESVVSAHEVIHDAVHKGQYGFIFTLDYEKAYDRVDRDFLLRVMRMRGFSPRWMSTLRGSCTMALLVLGLMTAIVSSSSPVEV
jgi:hypothetical protein